MLETQGRKVMSCELAERDNRWWLSLDKIKSSRLLISIKYAVYCINSCKLQQTGLHFYKDCAGIFYANIPTF